MLAEGVFWIDLSEFNPDATSFFAITEMTQTLGYGANWITEWYAYDRGVLDALGLAQHERIAGFIHIGRPPGPPEDRPRPPLNEIAVRFTA